MIKTLACHKAEPTVLSNHAVNSDNTTMNKAQCVTGRRCALTFARPFVGTHPPRRVDPATPTSDSRISTPLRRWPAGEDDPARRMTGCTDIGRSVYPPTDSDADHPSTQSHWFSCLSSRQAPSHDLRVGAGGPDPWGHSPLTL